MVKKIKNIINFILVFLVSANLVQLAGFTWSFLDNNDLGIGAGSFFVKIFMTKWVSGILVLVLVGVILKEFRVKDLKLRLIVNACGLVLLLALDTLVIVSFQ